MKPKQLAGAVLAAIMACTNVAAAGEPATVPMHDKGASTFYVPVTINGWGTGDFLVDTGSSYMVISEEMQAVLEEAEQAVYVRDLAGTLADGSRMIVPVYRIDEVEIGDGCVLRDVEAAVFPGSNRNILGLSVLGRMAPFRFSTEPPRLHVSGCNMGQQTAQAE